MLNKTKLYLLPIIFVSLLTSLFSQKIEPNNYCVQNVDMETIKERDDFYKNLFNPKRKLKKAAIVSTEIFGTILLSYFGFKCWNNYKAKQKASDDASNNSPTEKFDLNGIAEKRYKQKLNKYKSFKHYSKYLVLKNYKKSIGIFITLGVYYVASDILKPAKEALIDFFKSNDEKHFNRIIFNLSSSLKQLQELFTLENGKCYKEEIADHYNFFIENVENFLAITSAISSRRINAINNYQSIKNEQNLMHKNVFRFSETLNKMLNESDNIFFDKTIADQIFESFKQVNNQIFRFINFSNAVIYES